MSYAARVMSLCWVQSRNGGAHLGFLAALVASGSKGHIAAGSFTIADVAVFNILDNHLQIFQKEITDTYPELITFHEKISAMPAIKAYFGSEDRLAQNNANGLG